MSHTDPLCLNAIAACALAGAIVVCGPSCSRELSAAQVPPSPSEGTVNLPGVRLWVKDTLGAGTPIVFLHANTGTSETWEHQFEAFARAGYRVIAFDRRGAGRSLPDPGTGPQPGTAADDLESLAGYLRLGRFHLVGLAGGGFIALDYAASHPNRLRSLVVAASTGRFEEKEMLTASDNIRMPGFDKMPADFRELGPSYRIEHPEGVVRWAEIERRSQQPGAVQPMRTPQTFAKLESIKVPILALAGGADLIAPPALMRLWTAHAPGSTFVIIPDAGHALAWERPELFNRQVLDFVAMH